MADEKTGGFSRHRRIRRKVEFEQTYRQGVRVSSGAVRLVGRRSETGASRLGIAVGRRLGNAVKRNRLKRWAREVFRRECRACADGAALDVIVSFGEPIANATYAEVVGHYRAALLRLRRRLDTQ